MSTVVSPDDVMDAVERAAERLSHEAVRRLLVRAEAAHRLLRADPALDGYELLAAVVWPSEMMERMLEDWLRAEDEAAYHAILVEAA